MKKILVKIKNILFQFDENENVYIWEISSCVLSQRYRRTESIPFMLKKTLNNALENILKILCVLQLMI